MNEMARLVVLGGGESGFGTAVLAKKAGHKVFLSDSGKIADKYRKALEDEGVEFEEGGHSEERILCADEVVKSPGIPDTAPLIVKLRDRGIPVISEIEFAARYTNAKFVCITGSNGKTTTTTLTYNIFKEGCYDVGLAGNIGDSLAYQVAKADREWYVVELSSFQLDGMEEFKADIAVLMNITPDHLDRYGYDMQRYADSKMRIIQNQEYDDWFVYCADDPVTGAQLERRELQMRTLPFTVKGREELMERYGHQNAKWQGAHMAGDDFCAVVGDRSFAMPLSDLKIKGVHNTYDAMAAVLAAMAAGVPDNAIRKALTDFGGVEHRLEPAGEIDGVAYVNDSKATNTDAVWYALDSMLRPTVWIAGGTDKGNDYDTLKGLVGEKVKALVCMGVDNAKLLKAFDGVVPVIRDTHSLEEAMSAAREEASEGDVVLLSPACASFDLFRNYEDRGRQFKQWVKNHK